MKIAAAAAALCAVVWAEAVAVSPPTQQDWAPTAPGTSVAGRLDALFSEGLADFDWALGRGAGRPWGGLRYAVRY